jgi:putative transposase
MGVPILIATRNLAFGELAQQHLKIHDLYSPARAENGAAALQLAQNTVFKAAIIDHDLPDMSQKDLAKGLRDLLPRIRLIVVPPRNDPNNLDWDGPAPDAFLKKPFYFRDLLSVMESAMAKILPAADVDEPIIALKDVDAVKLINETELQAFKIFGEWSYQEEVSSGSSDSDEQDRVRQILQEKILIMRAKELLLLKKEELWVCAGELSQDGAKELARLVVQHWDRNKPGELIRFINPSFLEREHLLFAAFLNSGMVIAALFEAETLIQEIRIQVRALAQHFTVWSRSEEKSTVDGDAGTEFSESRAFFHAKYACCLVPRLAYLELTSSAAEQLSHWVPQLCQAFEWQLIYLSIEPDHIHWVVDVPPATSPAGLVQLFRKHTSLRIFSKYPQLCASIPSGDFWAPGYLITPSDRPLPGRVLAAFVQRTRSQAQAEKPPLLQVKNASNIISS